MKKFICIHGHFYQPPRENPWLEAVEVQDSAYPFHDWNERVTVECYAPNGAARLMDGEGRIIDIVNNYAGISFDFGPTLLRWMERRAVEEYQRIVDADRRSVERFDGHGSAMAMPYNHSIMPLNSARDRRTQIAWGLSEFRRHFGREPEGMWLPETAVDTATLEDLVEHGIRFTVLAPRQARRIRKIDDKTGDKDEKKWKDVSDGSIDSTRPYLCRLPSGRSIAIFFYHPSIAHKVAFGDVLNNGERFAEDIISAFDDRKEAQLIHVATDGESYGHHRAHADMALAYALHTVEESDDAELTNYARHLADHKPRWEVEVFENSSWSCAHGVDRWRGDCGCKIDPGRNWHQRWRKPLRESFDWLRSQIDPFYERRAAELLDDPWAAREAYISVIADRSRENVDRFCAEHSRRKLTNGQQVELLKLLEMQRHGMLIYTSCAWFFDDVSGIEPVQNLRYACRVVQLADELGLALEDEFLEHLAHAESNVELVKDGAGVYRRYVRPSVANLRRVAAHAAMESAQSGELGEGDRYCYRIVPRDFRYAESSGTSLALGRIETESLITRETDDLTFAVLSLPGHDVQCAVLPTRSLSDSESIKEKVLTTYQRASISETIRSFDRHFGEKNFTLKDLFLDSRRRILAGVIRESLERYSAMHRDLYDATHRLMEFARESEAPLPKSFLVAAEEVLNEELEKEIDRLLGEYELEELPGIKQEARKWGVSLNFSKHEPRLRAHLDDLLAKLVEGPDRETAERAAWFVRKINEHGLPLFFWKAQNLFDRALDRHGAWLLSAGDNRRQMEALRSLGEALGFRNGGMPQEEVRSERT